MLWYYALASPLSREKRSLDVQLKKYYSLLFLNHLSFHELKCLRPGVENLRPD